LDEKGENIFTRRFYFEEKCNIFLQSFNFFILLLAHFVRNNKGKTEQFYIIN